MVEVYGKESSVPEYGMVFLIIKYFIKIASFFKFIFLITREYRFYLSIFLSTSWNFSFCAFLSLPANCLSSFIDNVDIRLQTAWTNSNSAGIGDLLSQHQNKFLL